MFQIVETSSSRKQVKHIIITKGTHSTIHTNEQWLLAISVDMALCWCCPASRFCVFREATCFCSGNVKLLSCCPSYLQGEQPISEPILNSSSLKKQGSFFLSQMHAALINNWSKWYTRTKNINESLLLLEG